MRFAEFAVGQVLRAGPLSVLANDVIAFATAFDPQPFHIDSDSATHSRWGGLIASGWHTCALAMRMVSVGLLQGSDSMGSPGLAYLRWPTPVRPGDRLRLEAHVLHAAPSSSGRVGVLRWRWIVLNQHDLPVLDTEVTSLFDLAQKSR
jgi:acyl dehydratase